MGDGESLRRLQARFEPHYYPIPSSASSFENKDPTTQQTPEKIDDKPAQKDMPQCSTTEKPPEQPTGDKAAGKKVRAEDESLNSDHFQFRYETTAAFCEMTNYLVEMARKSTEMAKKEVAASQSALKMAEDWEKRAEKALDDVKLCEMSLLIMGREIEELYREVEVTKMELAEAKVVAENAVKKAEDSEKRAVKAEKALEDVKKVLEEHRS